MSKVYIIVSVQGSTGQVAGLFGPDDPWSVERWGVGGSAVRYRDAAPELREQVRNAVDEKFPDEASYLMSEMGDRAFLFTRRKAAREVLANLNEDVTWEWRIIECGPPAARDMRPVLGWQIMFDRIESAHNYTQEARQEYGAFELELDSEERILCMFPTRAKARAYFRSIISDGPDYKIVPVYGAYRVDPEYTPGSYSSGGLRFRTKGAAEEFARETYHDPSGTKYRGYRIVLHDAPVPESLLYAPL